MSVPDNAVGVYWELWCPAGERTHPDTIDEEGYRRVGVGSETFIRNTSEDPEDYTEEALEDRHPEDWKVKNHKWLYTKEGVDQ